MKVGHLYKEIEKKTAKVPDIIKKAYFNNVIFGLA